MSMTERNAVLPGVQCCVKKCQKSKTDFVRIQLFKFPPSYTKIGKVWRKKCQIPESDYEKPLFICKNHFANFDLGKRNLKMDAIPTIGLDEMEQEEDTQNGDEMRCSPKSKSCDDPLADCEKQGSSNMVKANSMNEDDSSATEVSETSEIIDNKLSKLLRRWIIKEFRSYDLIESEGLKAIFQEITRLGSKLENITDVNQLLPTSSEVLEKLSEIYEKCFDTVKEEVSSIKDDNFSLTVDINTDEMIEGNYIAITIHYTKNGVLCFRLLGLQALEGEQSSDHDVIANIEQVLDNYACKLSSRTILVTNKNNIHIKNETDIQNLSCMSQLLNDALNNSVQEVPEVKQIISAVSDLVTFLIKRRQNTVLGELANNSCNNCWVTTCNMLNAIENNWSKIEKILQNMNEVGKMSKLNKQHLKAVIEVFQPLAEAIGTLEDSNSATLHLVFVLMHELKKSFVKTDIEIKQFKFIENLKKNIRNHLEKIAAEDISILHKIALFLYPPANQLLSFNADEKKYIETECIRLMQNYKQVSNSTAEEELELPTTSVPKRKKLFADFVPCETQEDSHRLLNQEIQFYKNTYVLNSDDFDVLNWWELRKEYFPLLYKLSCAVLSTPATCVATKRIFSASSNLFRDKPMRSSREAEIEKIMFVNSNAELSY